MQSSSVTVTGDLVGTVRYMSPEQAKGQAALVDGGSDIYGLAATLYEMLTFRPAIEGDEPTVILKHISERHIKPLRSLRSDLPRDLAVVISKAMSHHRYDRYETAQAFADDLRRVLDNKPTIARPATLLERAVLWTVRHQRTATIAASVLGLLILGLIVSFSLITAQKRKTELIARRSIGWGRKWPNSWLTFRQRKTNVGNCLSKLSATTKSTQRTPKIRQTCNTALQLPLERSVSCTASLVRPKSH
jgi:serine/threonine protein kinase